MSGDNSITFVQIFNLLLPKISGFHFSRSTYTFPLIWSFNSRPVVVVSFLAFYSDNLSSNPTVWTYQPCDKMMELKVAQFFTKLAKKKPNHLLHESCIIWNSPKNYKNIWATFVRKSLTKKLKNRSIWSHCPSVKILRKRRGASIAQKGIRLHLPSSVTRFGEISPLLPKVDKIRQTF